LVANVDEYLPGAVDGWTWAVDLITDAAGARRTEPLVAATAQVGGVIAELHAALSSTATVATRQDAARWRNDGLATLEDACALGDSVAVTCARARRYEIEALLDSLGALAAHRSSKATATCTSARSCTAATDSW